MLKYCAGHLYLAVHTLSALLKNITTLSFLVCGRDITVLGVLLHRGPCTYVSKPGLFPSLPNKKLETNDFFYQ